MFMLIGGIAFLLLGITPYLVFFFPIIEPCLHSSTAPITTIKKNMLVIAIFMQKLFPS